MLLLAKYLGVGITHGKKGGKSTSFVHLPIRFEAQAGGLSPLSRVRQQ